MSDSVHDKLERVRKPRVHIKYEVSTDEGTVEKDLPFVMGVMGDYSGDNQENKKPLRERDITEIDRDNFNDVMNNINPKLNLKVENTLTAEGGEMAVDLSFNNMEDFEPQKIVSQVEPLQQLLDTRNKLRDLLTKADRSLELESVLEKILSETESLDKIATELKGDEK